MDTSLFSTHAVDCFDENKPFHGILVGFLAQLHGHIELAGRAFVDDLEGENPANDPWFLRNLGSEYCRRATRGEKTPLPHQINPVSKHADDAVEVDLEKLSSECQSLVLDGGFGVAYEQAAGSLLITAKALLDDHYNNTEAQQRSPRVEFLRHCRNAAAHGGTFNLKAYGEPRAPAHWRGLVLAEDYHGDKLFKTPQEEGHLQAGDPILLLWDIEQQHPDILQ